jgi:hypothetical protein
MKLQIRRDYCTTEGEGFLVCLNLS